MTKKAIQFTLAINLAVTALLVALIVLVRPVIAADECVIPGGGSGCFASIQAAVNAAGSGDTVWVVAGVYPERVVITKDLTLVGGCTTSACTARNPGTSTIHGGGNGVVISITNSAVVTIDGFTITGGNGTANNGRGGGVFIRQATAIIRNNIITGNVASTAPDLIGVGGGIYVISGTHPVGIYRNTIQANLAYSVTSGSAVGVGGGISIDSASSAIITGNQILSNIAAQTQVPSANAAGYGGGMFLGGGDTVAVADNTIQGNLGMAQGREGFGGGMYIYRTPFVTLTNNIIAQNTAIISGSNASGGGVYLETSPTSGAKLVLMGNWVISNTAGVTLTGSSLYIEGGGVNIGGGGDNDTLMMQDNHLVGNVAVNQLVASANGFASGGGLSVHNLTGASIISNEILSNVGAYTIAPSGGGNGATGGINLVNSSALVQGNVISGNTARRDEPGEGEAMSVNGGVATMTQNRILGNRSRGVFALISTLTSTNDVIARNTGGGLRTGSIGPPTQVTMINDTLYNNGQVGIEAGQGTTVSVTNTIVSRHEDGLRANSTLAILVGNYNLLSNTLNYAGGVTGGPNDILNQDPLFVDAAKDDFHLASGSPAIDKGTSVGAPSVDFEGDSRPQGPGVDIGADEWSQLKIYLPIIRKNS